jgi:BMFP domain-containing protein YqiC
MTQTSNRFYDQFARFVNDAASVAQGVRREAETLFHSQAERFMNGMDLVRREDFDAVREMAARAREENARLEARIAELEAKLGAAASAAPAAKPARPRTRKAPGSAGPAPQTES